MTPEQLAVCTGCRRIALAGALLPLTAQATATRTEGAWLLLRCTLTATAHHWEQGVPDRFLKPMARGFHRRATDRLP